VQASPTGGFRRFVQTGAGRALLIAFAILVVFVAYAYISPILAIPAFLVVGLFVPIYLGLKRPRYLALSGLVVVLLVAPLATAVFTQEIMAPVPAAESSSSLPDGGNGSVLQNATVTPFNGGTGTDFTWSVSIYPQYLTSSILFPVERGSYPYHVGAVPGYRSSGPSGNLSVQSLSYVNLSFVPASQAVTFTETGLSPTTGWTVTLNGTLGASNNSTVVFDVRNGTYNYTVQGSGGFVPTATSGRVSVSGPTGVAVKFGSASYPVTFHETGLRPGTGWNVAVGSTSASSTSDQVVLLEVNGSHTYTVGTLTGFTSTPSSGPCNVTAAPVSVTITFTPVHQVVTFSESGLPTGTSWSVTFNSSSPSTANRSLGFLFSNAATGAKNYTVGAVAGYGVHPAGGTVTLSGSPQNVNLTFTPNVAAVEVTEFGLPWGTNWSVELGTATITTHATPTAVLLFVSTCPGATTNNSATCPSGYPFHIYQVNLTTPLTTVTKETFSGIHVSENGVWTWQLALAVHDAATGNFTYVYLVGDPTYDSIEGPVVGGFSVIFFAVLGSIYLDVFLFLALPFYFILLLYMMFKGRESRRRGLAARPSASIPPSSGSAPSGAPSGGPSKTLPSASSGPPGASSPPPPGANERACPNCGAVVYVSEKTCWKCGATLPAASPGT
jgi:hypothetical protein